MDVQVFTRPRPRRLPPSDDAINAARGLLKRARAFERLAYGLRQRAARKLGRGMTDCQRQ